ncbi:MAG: EamA family transporter [Treponema sp.]|nr:EamA family transporter [Candidatus Treponema equifaecale]
MNFSYIWPLAIIIFSNIFYQVCAKGIPQEMNTYASMAVTYAVSTLFSLTAFFITSKGAGFFSEFSKTNWATIILGIVITGLEVGFIFAYKAGWKVSTLATVSNAFLAVALLLVGLFFYHEAINWSKILGAAICLVGLWFINR